MFRQALRPSLSSSLRTRTGSSVTRVSRRVVLGPISYRYISQEARTKLQASVGEKPVVLFMKGTPDFPQCGFSRAVVKLLDINGVPTEKLKTYNVLEDQELRNDLKEFSEWPTIPQVYVNGEFVGGCDILIGMHQSGELEKLLQKHDIVPKTTDSSTGSEQQQSS